MARTFHYERSILIDAPIEAIAPDLYDLARHAHWSPFSQPDPKRRDTITGQAGVGQVCAFAGGRSGSGHIRVDAVEPHSIRMTLTMLKPMKATNQVEYALHPEQGGVRVSWIMSGPMTLFGRLMNVFIDCEAMCGGMFEKGLAALKTRVESRASLSPVGEGV